MKNNETKLTRSEQKQRAVLKAAKEIFLNQGFMCSSMDDIAKQAGVSKKTVYHHFGNKETLFRHMLKAYWLDTLSGEAVLFKPEQTIQKNLKHFAKAFFRFIYDENTIKVLRILIGEGRQFQNLADDILVEGKAPYTQALIAYLQDQSQQGKLKIKDSKRASSFFIGLLKEDHFWPMMLGFVKTKRPSNPNVLIDEAIALFCEYYQVVK